MRINRIHNAEFQLWPDFEYRLLLSLFCIRLNQAHLNLIEILTPKLITRLLYIYESYNMFNFKPSASHRSSTMTLSPAKHPGTHAFLPTKLPSKMGFKILSSDLNSQAPDVPEFAHQDFLFSRQGSSWTAMSKRFSDWSDPTPGATGPWTPWTLGTWELRFTPSRARCTKNCGSALNHR